MSWIVVLLAVVTGLWLVTRLYLKGPTLVAFDAPAPQVFAADPGSLPVRRELEGALAAGMGPIQQQPRSQQLAAMRAFINQFGAGLDLPSKITAVDAGGVDAEWVVAPGVDTARRLLYIHGGAFVMGSPVSHRNITHCMSEAANAAVLAIDYRLMPEHPRRAGIEDCQRAYCWLRDNGPEGPGAARSVFVAGDSAGGNLTLMMTAWARDHGPAPVDAAVALSPVTDFTLSSPSLKDNLESDAMLGPMFGKLARIPAPLLLWLTWLQHRLSPAAPQMSPAFGNLGGLPPTLVQASASEMLRDDAIRYANRAAAAGSPVQVQLWEGQMHVWQLFHPQLPEAGQAWQEIRRFFETLEPR